MFLRDMSPPSSGLKTSATQENRVKQAVRRTSHQNPIARFDVPIGRSFGDVTPCSPLRVLTTFQRNILSLWSGSKEEASSRRGGKVRLRIEADVRAENLTR